MTKNKISIRDDYEDDKLSWASYIIYVSDDKTRRRMAIYLFEKEIASINLIETLNLLTENEIKKFIDKFDVLKA